MTICSVQMQTDNRPACLQCYCTGLYRANIRCRRHGLTLIELMVVMVILSAFVAIAQLNLFGLLEKRQSKSQLQELVSTMQMAASAAGQSDRRYEVIIDLEHQSFLLRQITTPDLSQVLDEEIITTNELNENCKIEYVQFDDGQYTSQGRAKFRAGHTGWSYGGKIVLLDAKGDTYSIVVNRLNRIIALEEGDAALLEPKDKNEITF